MHASISPNVDRDNAWTRDPIGCRLRRSRDSHHCSARGWSAAHCERSIVPRLVMAKAADSNDKHVDTGIPIRSGDFVAPIPHVRPNNRS